jgi:hypothetical protein
MKMLHEIKDDVNGVKRFKSSDSPPPVLPSAPVPPTFSKILHTGIHFFLYTYN